MIPSRKAVIEMTVGLLVIAGTVQADPTVINTCPTVINSPGRYLLGADLICPGSGNGITITSSDVTLALEGHSITTNGSASSVIAASRVERVRILGPGLIRSGGGTFFFGVSFSNVNHSEVSGITMVRPLGAGITADTCDFLTITANTLGLSVTAGIDLVDVLSSTISENSASGNRNVGIAIRNPNPRSGSANMVNHNIVNGNGEGLQINEGPATVQNNITNGNAGDGIFLPSPVGTNDVEVSNNTSLANGSFDLFDASPNCTGHVWSGNKFFTANQSCIH